MEDLGGSYGFALVAAGVLIAVLTFVLSTRRSKGE